MRVSYGGGENVKHARYSELKQYEYFKQVFKNAHDIQLKEMLTNYVFKISTRHLDHQNYVYLPEKSIDSLQIGKKIHKSVSSLTKRTPLIRLQKKVDEILTHIIHLEIPVLQKLKSQYRFLCLTLSHFYSYPFNRLILKKGQPYNGIYYVVEGDLVLGENGHITRIISKGGFVGLKQCFNNTKNWPHSIYSNSNETKVWFMTKQNLDVQIDVDEKTLKEKFQQYYSEKQTKQTIQQTNRKSKLTLEEISNLSNNKDDQKKQKEQSLTLNSFMKRCQDFKHNINVFNSAGFNQYVQKKKIIVKLEETMKISRQNLESVRKNKYEKACKNRRQAANNCQLRILKSGRVSKQTLLLSAQQFMHSPIKEKIQKNRNDLQKSQLLKRIYPPGPENQRDKNLMTINSLR